MKKLFVLFSTLILCSNFAFANVCTLEEGQKLAEDKDYTGAITCFDDVIKHNHKNVQAYIDRGIAKANLNEFDAAYTDLNKALKLSPNNYDAYIARGAAYSMDKKFDESIKDLTKAIEINPCVQAYSARAMIYIENKDLEKAKQDIESARKIEPKNGGLRMLDGLIALQEGKYVKGMWNIFRAKRSSK